ncbi:MAG: ArsR/SmtB family transcription factor [Acidimicrobiales bacterium]
MPTAAQVDRATETMRMLGDATRLRVLWALVQSERSVGDLAQLVGAQPAAVSQHLAKLRLARLVKTRREGNRVFYGAADIHVRQLVEEALYHADHVEAALPDHRSTR